MNKLYKSPPLLEGPKPILLLWLFMLMACSLQAQNFVKLYKGTMPLAPYDFIEVGNKLFFVGNDAVHGRELWATDGTTTGTHMVKELWAGHYTGEPVPAMRTEYNGRLYFTASEQSTGRQLYSTDGTDTGTHIVKMITPNGYTYGAQDVIGWMLKFNGKLYFCANDSVHGYELWTSDGTASGTQIVADIYPGTFSGFSSGEAPVIFNGAMYFIGSSGTVPSNSSALWKTDGTAAGTVKVAGGMTIQEQYNSRLNFISSLRPFNGYLYFTANTTGCLYDPELWRTDGTMAGTTLVKDILPGCNNSFDPYWLTPAGSRLYMGRSPGKSDTAAQLWATDGTATNTGIVSRLNTGSTRGSTPDYLTAYGAKVYLRADNDTVRQAFVSDGTQAGTRPITTGLNVVAPQGCFFTFGGKVYFPAAPGGSYDYKLYSYDTLGGITQEFAPSWATSTRPVNTYTWMGQLGNKIVFEADYDGETWLYIVDPQATAVPAVSTTETWMSLSPNPVKNKANITSLYAGRLMLTDATGRRVREIVFKQGNTEVSIGELSAGIYFYQCITPGGQSMAGKLMKN